jgi:SOS-response transcriptional repressor LexA
MTRQDFLLQGVALERLREAANRFGTRDALAEKTKMPKPTIEKILAGKSDPSISRLGAMCDALGLGVDYLFTGMDGTPEAANDRGNEERDLKRIPVFAVRVSAGHGRAVAVSKPSSMLAFDATWLRDHFANTEHLNVLRVTGESMEPELRDGDIIMIDRLQTKVGDGLYVVTFGDEVYVKRVQRTGTTRYRLLSTNPLYPPIDVDLDRDGGFVIAGRVVWAGRRM